MTKNGLVVTSVAVAAGSLLSCFCSTQQRSQETSQGEAKVVPSNALSTRAPESLPSVAVEEPPPLPEAHGSKDAAQAKAADARREQERAVLEMLGNPDSTGRAIREALQPHFDREPVDRSWGPQFTAEFRVALTRWMSPTSVIEHLECRSTMCVLKITHATERDGDVLYSKLFVGRDSEFGRRMGGVTFTYDGENDSRHILFILREGASWPNIEPSPRKPRK